MTKNWTHGRVNNIVNKERNAWEWDVYRPLQWPWEGGCLARGCMCSAAGCHLERLALLAFTDVSFQEDFVVNGRVCISINGTPLLAERHRCVYKLPSGNKVRER